MGAATDTLPGILAIFNKSRLAERPSSRSGFNTNIWRSDSPAECRKEAVREFVAPGPGICLTPTFISRSSGYR
jgi:hypothetical protein